MCFCHRVTVTITTAVFTSGVTTAISNVTTATTTASTASTITTTATTLVGTHTVCTDMTRLWLVDQ